MRTDGKPSPIAQHVAENVTELRGREVSLRELSARLGALGRPVLPSGVLGIERGTRRVDVDDLVALAVALGVTPNRLLLPGSAETEAEEVDLTPTVSVPERDAWRWSTGEAPLPGEELTAQRVIEFARQNRPHDKPLTHAQAFGLLPTLVPLFEALGKVAEDKGVSVRTIATLLREWDSWRDK